MDFLKSHLFTAFLISIIYFIVKILLNKMNKNKESSNMVRKTVLKDSILLFSVTYLILIFKDQIFFTSSKKTEIFTTEPNF